MTLHSRKAPSKMESVTPRPRAKAKLNVEEELELVSIEEVDEDEREEKVEKSLEAIYVDEKGRVPDLSRLTRRRTSGWARFLLGLSIFSLVAAGLAWTGLVYGPTWFKKQTIAEAMTLSIKTSPTV